MAKREPLEWWATKRGGGKELVIGFLPVYPHRVSLLTAHQEAMGLELVERIVLDDQGNPTDETERKLESVRDPSGEDLVAVAYAAIGLCWDSPDIEGRPNFRECGRDVIDFGERFQTAMLEVGYLEDGIIEASKPVIDAMQDSVFRMMGLITEEERGFEGAQEEGATP